MVALELREREEEYERREAEWEVMIKGREMEVRKIEIPIIRTGCLQLLESTMGVLDKKRQQYRTNIKSHQGKIPTKQTNVMEKREAEIQPHNPSGHGKA